MLPPRVAFETRSVLKQCNMASRALAELKGIGRSIPNQEILINALPLQEAKSSSEIENIITTSDSLYRALSLKETDNNPHTKEVLRYREALRSGMGALRIRPLLDIALFERICSVLLDAEIGVRTIQVALYDQYKEVVYTPPHSGAYLRALLVNLEHFINKDTALDPLIKMALIHYQFEAIHPFIDGNGRTGRILNILYLIQQNLLDIPVIYLSRYFIRHRKSYYQLLRKVSTSADWEQWILYMLSAVAETARHTTEKIEAIQKLFDEYMKRARWAAPAANQKELIELIFLQPYCLTRFVEERMRISRLTARRRLAKLEEAGLVESMRAGRHLLFVNRRLFNVLSDDENNEQAT